MARPNQTGSAAGTSMSGHTCEPHATPQNRDDDDFNVTGDRWASHDRYRTGQYGRDERYEVRGRFGKDYNRDHDDHRDTRSRNHQDDPWNNAYPRRR